MSKDKNKLMDFDLNTNIFDKLQEEDNFIKNNNDNDKEHDYNKKLLNKKRKGKLSNDDNVWNYDKILKNETITQKIKKERRKKELKLEDEEDIENKYKEEKEEENKGLNLFEENEEDNDLAFNDKFESTLYAKGMNFSNFNLSKLMIKALSEMEFYTPTKVQEKVIPIALKGHDILVNSETGSGKTACYLLPIIQRIILNRIDLNKKNTKKKFIENKLHDQALILVPTRELALQCNEMLSKFLKYVDISYIFLCGGMSVENQLSQMKNSIPDIIIATPGRLLDIIYNYKNMSLEHVNILVLDEADKLLELGFKDAIFEILEIVKKNQNRQTLLFSATLNPKIIDLGEHALNNPIKIKMAQSAILTNLKQRVARIKFTNLQQNEYEKRMAYLINIIKTEKLSRTIIFFNTKQDCHKCLLILKKFGLVNCAEIHSDITQTERIKSLDDFQKDKVKFLLATDVAGRGIDIEKVKCVINFQMPLIGERYIHRVGRTARKGYLGQAITICDDKDRLVLKKLLRKEKIYIEIENIKINNQDIKDIYKKIINQQKEIENKIVEEKTEKEYQLAKRDIDKTMNYKFYEKEIKNRPKKRWYETPKEKRKKAKENKKAFDKKKEELYNEE